jgi:2'-5' RNA ligase
VRLFVAARPSAAACAALARSLGRPADPRWHVTLAFLGEQPAAEPFDLAEVARRHAPFTLRLESAGTFGGAVLWAGLGGDTGALRSLAVDVQQACREAGAELEVRPYHAHLTVARGRRLRVPARLRAHHGPDWTVQGVELVRSVLGPPTTHEVLAHFPLGS